MVQPQFKFSAAVRPQISWDYQGREAQDGHFDLHTAPELWELSVYHSALLYVHRDCTDYLGQGAQDDHLNFHTAPELWTTAKLQGQEAIYDMLLPTIAITCLRRTPQMPVSL